MPNPLESVNAWRLKIVLVSRRIGREDNAIDRENALIREWIATGSQQIVKGLVVITEKRRAMTSALDRAREDHHFAACGVGTSER